jgi:glycosylphosphatidylinositol transamidase (GPIT) subunit GPI8
LTENGHVLTSCHSDLNIDYKDTDFHNFQLIDILKGRSSQMLNHFRKLNSNRNSRLVLMISSHGGDTFIKVRGRSVVLSDEMNRALNEMHIKGRYKEILFILDTCEGFTLFDNVDAPNIYFIASSVKDQKSKSYSWDPYVMSPSSDRFHHKLYETLQEIYKRKNFDYNINNMFLSIQKQREFIQSDVTIRNQIKRDIIFEEFFGNYLKKNSLILKYNFEFESSSNVSVSASDKKSVIKISDDFKKSTQINKNLNEMRLKTDEEVLNIRKYSENNFILKHEEKENFSNFTSEGHLGINSIFFVILLYLIFNLIKN